MRTKLANEGGRWLDMSQHCLWSYYSVKMELTRLEAQHDHKSALVYGAARCLGHAARAKPCCILKNIELFRPLQKGVISLPSFYDVQGFLNGPSILRLSEFLCSAGASGTKSPFFSIDYRVEPQRDISHRVS